MRDKANDGKIVVRKKGFATSLHEKFSTRTQAIFMKFINFDEDGK
jgi:hypothetical protein